MTLIESKLSKEGLSTQHGNGEAAVNMCNWILAKFSDFEKGERDEASALFMLSTEPTGNDHFDMHSEVYAKFCDAMGITPTIAEGGTDIVSASSIDPEYPYYGLLHRTYTPYTPTSGHVEVSAVPTAILAVQV